MSGVNSPEPPSLARFAAELARRFEQQHEAGERDHWQESFELQLDPRKTRSLTLVRGADLPPDERLVVFDDITEVVSAQRSAAWSEVARRSLTRSRTRSPHPAQRRTPAAKLEAKLEGPTRTSWSARSAPSSPRCRP